MNGLLARLGVLQEPSQAVALKQERAVAVREERDYAAVDNSTIALRHWASRQKEATGFATLLQAMQDSDLIEHPLQEWDLRRCLVNEETFALEPLADKTLALSLSADTSGKD